MDTTTWEAAGLYDPSAPGAAERRELLAYLVGRGATIESMVEAHRINNLPGLAGELAVGEGPPPRVPLPELAHRTGLSEERLHRVMVAAGLPLGSDGSIDGDLDGLFTAFQAGSAVFGDEGVLAFARVMGAAARNITEAAVALFYAEVGPGSGRQGPDELARARVAETASLAFSLLPDAFNQLLRAQFYRVTRSVAGTRVWGDVAEPAGAGEAVALGFVDLVGSTAWAEGLSLREHSLALSRFESAAWSSAVLAGGRVVKMVGDEVFFAAPTVEAASRIGLEVCAAVAADPVLPPARGAVGFGLVTPREGDYFGPLVNFISRLVKAAAPGELVVTEEAAAGLDRDGWTVEALTPVALRGVEGEARAFRVRGAD